MPYKDKDKQKQYQRQYQKKWIQDRRKEFFRDKECKNCGTKKDLQLHHRNPDDKVDHKVWSWRKERREKEIQKCDVLCRSCHSKHHHPRSTKHGTLTMYKNHKCRCEICRAKNSKYEYDRRRRGRTKSPIMVSRDASQR